MVTDNEPHGVLIVDKPEGPSSFHVVAGARKLFHTRRVGHAGTLDPMATGVLVILLGEATKLSAYLTQEDKTYEATVQFGIGTDTLDRYGTVLSSQPVPAAALGAERLLAALKDETERTLQEPPQYSAIKVDGQRAYALSRRGEDVELAPRPVRVLGSSLLEHSGTTAVFSLTVSKGYYVRSFARDLGRTLGLDAHLSALRRTASGAFAVAEASPWPQVTAPALLSCESAIRRVLPSAVLTDAGALFARQGKLLPPDSFEAAPPPGSSAWFDAGGRLMAIGADAEDGGYRVRRGLNL